jgi:nucleoside-diphosphate-sugar epimerase
MRILVAGGTGVIGRQLLPLLGEVGHDAIVLARAGGSASPGRAPVIAADALDRRDTQAAVEQAAPDVIVNLLTAIPRALEPRKLARQMALTNRLRSEGTDNLLAAAAGARVVSASLAYAYRPAGGAVADESRPLWTDGPRPFRRVARALLDLERATTDAGGVVLRLGHLYGPGTAFARDGAFVDQVTRGRVPLVGGGDAMFSFLHTHDAATSVVAALDKPVGGVLNVVDDDPTPVHDWLPALARMVGGPPPKHVPAALARLGAGAWGVAYLDRLVGADNTRARLALDWRPRFSTWRLGFEAELGSASTSNPGR